MSGQGSGSADPLDGAPSDGEDADCAVCKCDLWLSAVVAVPSVVGEVCGGGGARGGGGAANGAAAARPRMRVDRRMVCPEHASLLGLPPARLRLLYRHSLEELEGMVADACRWVPGASEAVAAARARAKRASPAEKGAAVAIPVGPLSQETVLRRKLEAERAEKRARKKAEAAKAEAAEAAAAAAKLEEKDGGLFDNAAAAPLPTSLPPSPGDLFASSPAPVAWDE